MSKQQPSHFAETLARLVEERCGGNRSEAADKIGVSPSTIKRWIDNQMEPKSSQLQQIARAFGLSVDDLMGHSPHAGIGSVPIASAEQAAAVDWLVSRGEQPDSVAMAAAIVARGQGAQQKRNRLWWTHEILAVLRDLS